MGTSAGAGAGLAATASSRLLLAAADEVDAEMGAAAGGTADNVADGVGELKSIAGFSTFTAAVGTGSVGELGSVSIG